MLVAYDPGRPAYGICRSLVMTPRVRILGVLLVNAAVVGSAS
jgi:hypothetical protein